MTLPKYLTTVTTFSKILAMILFVVLPIIGFVLGVQYQTMINFNQNNNLDNVLKKIPSISPTIIQPSLISINPKENDYVMPVFNTEVVNKTLEKIYSGKIEYIIKNGEVPTYVYNDNSLFSVTSYLYKKGNSKFPSGYEEIKWERDLDNDVNQFLSFKLGKQTAKYYEGVGEGYDISTELKKIGNRNYAVVDVPFSPSASWTRVYYTFDSKTNQLIYISFTFYNLEAYVNKSNHAIQYPQTINTFLNDIEQKILTLY